MKPGFTLLETLVAVAIFGFLLVGLSGGARFGVDAALRQARDSNRRGDLDAVDRVLRQVVAAADPTVPLAGSPGRMTLATTVPNEAGLQQVALGLIGGRFVLRFEPRPPGLALSAPQAHEAELASDVRSLAFSYYAPADRDHAVARWQPDWSGPNLPPLIRLSLRFADSSAPGWPDIVLSTERTR